MTLDEDTIDNFKTAERGEVNRKMNPAPVIRVREERVLIEMSRFAKETPVEQEPAHPREPTEEPSTRELPKN